jgi:hypothetical protein
METLIGFAVGYWIGTRHGRKGLEDAMDTMRELWTSPAGQRLLREGTSALQGVLPVADAVRKNRRGTRGALIGSIVDELLERRSAREAAA